MFKLIKIQNSGRNVPEPEKLKKFSPISIKAGEALILDDGEVAPCPATVMPSYIAFAHADDSCETVVCYPITNDMLFETTINDSPESLIEGYKVTIGKDSDGRSVCVTSTINSGVATIVDLNGATKAGDKVTVRF